MKIRDMSLPFGKSSNAGDEPGCMQLVTGEYRGWWISVVQGKTGLDRLRRAVRFDLRKCYKTTLDPRFLTSVEEN
jgi:hypothetical protein